jgi:hypothetical protein
MVLGILDLSDTRQWLINGDRTRSRPCLRRLEWARLLVFGGRRRAFEGGSAERGHRDGIIRTLWAVTEGRMGVLSKEGGGEETMRKMERID